MTTTTAAGLDRAAELFQTDWDEGGTISIHLPADLAVDLLDRRGWKFIDLPPKRAARDVNGKPIRYGQWVAPDGRTFWHRDEALQFALAAEVS